MAIEAPLSKHKKTNFKIVIGLCLVFAIVFGYDGYLSKYEWSLRHSFYEEHVKDGKADDTMIFNQKSPFALVALAVICAGWLCAVKNKKLLADEKEIVISAKERIPYDSIEKIDKTHFKAKGSFIITYKNNDGREVNRKVSDRTYDNLEAILDKLVEEIS